MSEEAEEIFVNLMFTIIAGVVIVFGIALLVGSYMREKAAEDAMATAHDSPLDRMERDCGYEMTRDDEDCKQWISDDVTADDKGLCVKWQNVLTIRRDANNGECWVAKFSHDREMKFVIMVYGGLSRARALAFDALLAWHRCAKKAKIAR